MTSTIEEINIDKKVDEPKKVTYVSVESYLRKNFPMIQGEFKVDYNILWERHYRINFWAYSHENIRISSNFISRSFFVIIEKDGEHFTHKSWGK